MAEHEKTFDESLIELEKIVAQLEQGDVPLEEALDKMNEDGTAEKISDKWFGENKVLK